MALSLLGSIERRLNLLIEHDCNRRFSSGGGLCRSVGSYRMSLLLLNVFVLQRSNAKGIFQSLHESFHFCIGLWPMWCYSSVIESQVGRERGKTLGIERWSIVTLNKCRVVKEENIFSSFGMTAIADVLDTFSTSGKLNP